MKRIHVYLLSFLTLLITSCATTGKFPVSEVIPAADIDLKVKEDKNENFKISINAKHIASPDRLTPPASYYVVWVDTYDGYKNVGQLRSKNAKKAELQTLSPFQFHEILITAESNGDASYPEGVIISRTTFEHK
jgi:hypothetical protein